MLYQKILLDDAPYDLDIRPLTRFVEHRHADIEFNYCIKGSRSVIIDKKMHEIREGELSVIAPGVSHEFPYSEDQNRLVLTGVMGSAFLKKHFAAFLNTDFRSTIIDLNAPDSRNAKLKESLDTITAHLSSATPQSSLLITGELYKICSYLIDNVVPSSVGGAIDTGLEGLASIDGALQLIYYDYKKPVTVDEAALVTGYGKSYFCKLFKNTTGMTFHEALNRKRIELACGLLSETNLSISEIAEEVGFAESKSFCRVFKSAMGISPGAYRQRKKGENS